MKSKNEVKDKIFEEKIIECFKNNGGMISSWKVLYDFLRAYYAGNRCNMKGFFMSRAGFEGRVRSFVEEHSSDSRQYYFCNGRLQPEG